MQTTGRKMMHATATVKSATEGIAEIVVSAYGNVDHDGDIVVKGSVARQIAGEHGPRNPKGLNDHDWRMTAAVAKTLRMWEEDDGTHIEAQYNLETEKGRDAWSDLNFYKDDMEFSVGYHVVKAQLPDDDQKALGARRVITDWYLNEWSHVMLGANSQTRTVALKGLAADDASKAVAGSFEHTSARIREALTGLYLNSYVYPRATFGDRVVYDVENYNGGEDGGTYEATWADVDGTLTLGDPKRVEVVEVVQAAADDQGDAGGEGAASSDPAASDTKARSIGPRDRMEFEFLTAVGPAATL
jgi:HK97 family phage prohead protease